jgi:hypothetical protein
MNSEQNKKNEFEMREANMLRTLENIRQKSLDELYRSDKAVSEIIREIVDDELLDLETKERTKKYA